MHVEMALAAVTRRRREEDPKPIHETLTASWIMLVTVERHQNHHRRFYRKLTNGTVQCRLKATESYNNNILA
jgi:hypothetical protein